MFLLRTVLIFLMKFIKEYTVFIERMGKFGYNTRKYDNIPEERKEF